MLYLIILLLLECTKELLAFNYLKLNTFILVHCGLYINYITICFNTFDSYFSYISRILTLIILFVFDINYLIHF